MAYSTTAQNEIVKELLDAKIQKSFENNTQAMKRFKREAATENITGRGREFVLNLQNNESYGGIAEGGNFPAAGALVDDRATVNFRNQFASFDFTGSVEDLAGNMELQNSLQRIVKDTTEAFDEKQEFWLFGDGTGEIARIDVANTNDITCLNTVAYSHGARMIRKGQRLNAYDISGTAYRSGDMVVSSVNRSTDVVSVDSAAGSIAADDDDIFVFEDSYNTVPHGLKYSVADSGTTWNGLTRSATPGINSLVYDAASASIDFDILEAAEQRSQNIRGDAAPAWEFLWFSHPVQKRYLRSLARSAGNVSFNAQLAGNKNIDLIVKDVTPAGSEIVSSSWCAPSDMFGLRMQDWSIQEVQPRQVYKHSSGEIFIQSLGASTVYKDAKEGRIYWRYNFLCKNPAKQLRIKNLNFATADTRITRA